VIRDVFYPKNVLLAFCLSNLWWQSIPQWHGCIHNLATHCHLGNVKKPMVAYVCLFDVYAKWLYKWLGIFNTEPIVHHSMGLPIMARCDAVWIWTGDCSDPLLHWDPVPQTAAPLWSPDITDYHVVVRSVCVSHNAPLFLSWSNATQRPGWHSWHSKHKAKTYFVNGWQWPVPPECYSIVWSDPQSANTKNNPGDKMCNSK
jgi:hypothetical protein